MELQLLGGKLQKRNDLRLHLVPQGIAVHMYSIFPHNSSPVLTPEKATRQRLPASEPALSFR